MATVRLSEGVLVEVPAECVEQSIALSIEQKEVYDFPMIRAETMEHVLRFMRYRQDHPLPEIPKPLPSTRFVEMVGEEFYALVDLDVYTLYHLVKAADQLSIPDLMTLSVAKIASLVKGKDPEQIKAILDPCSLLTPEEKKTQ